MDSLACPFNTYANLGALTGSTTCNNCSANYDTAGTTGNTACTRTSLELKPSRSHAGPRLILAARMGAPSRARGSLQRRLLQQRPRRLVFWYVDGPCRAISAECNFFLTQTHVRVHACSLPGWILQHPWRALHQYVSAPDLKRSSPARANGASLPMASHPIQRARPTRTARSTAAPAPTARPDRTRSPLPATPTSRRAFVRCDSLEFRLNLKMST